MDLAQFKGSETVYLEDEYNSQWRAGDDEQRMLENARRLWERHVEDNRQAVDEHAEYVRNMATLSAFMAGFVNVAFVQFGFDPSGLSLPVLMGFGVSNALTMAVNTCCMATCTLILAGIFRTFNSLLSEEEEAAFIMCCREFAKGYQIGNRPPAPQRKFRNHWDFYCRAEWRRALFMFSTGIVCFMANTAFAAFIKFDDYRVAAISLAVALAPGLALVAYLHIRWVPHLLDITAVRPVDVDGSQQPMGMPFDWQLPGIRAQKVGATSLETATAWTELAQLPRWRIEVLAQRSLNNAMHLWQRYVNKTRNELEERVEQLRSFSFLSGVLAGFAIASLLQLTFSVSATAQGIQLWFSVSSGLAAACSTCSMAMCSLVLMSIIKTGRGLVSEQEESKFLAECHNFERLYQPGSRPPAPKKTFQNHWDTRCEGEWKRAFYLFSLGLAMFVVNMLAAAWIKYKPRRSVSIASNIIMGLALVYLFQAHSRWAPYLTGSQRSRRTNAFAVANVELPPAGLPFDWHLPPVQAQSGSLSRRVDPPAGRTTMDRLGATLKRMSSMAVGEYDSGN